MPSSFRVDGREWTPCGKPDELPQVEGIVVDGVASVLYAAQEDIERGAEPPPTSPTLFTADAEGLTIAGRTLLASSQGDSTFSLFHLGRAGVRHEKTFRIADSPASDSVEHSDGAAVATASFGAEFPYGLLVVHDGENTPAESRPNTNFKLLRWEQLAS